MNASGARAFFLSVEGAVIHLFVNLRYFSRGVRAIQLFMRCDVCDASLDIPAGLFHGMMVRISYESIVFERSTSHVQWIRTSFVELLAFGVDNGGRIRGPATPKE